jgi:ribosome-binding protein aMBF1 (putative translation factor)
VSQAVKTIAHSEHVYYSCCVHETGVGTQEFHNALRHGHQAGGNRSEGKMTRRDPNYIDAHVGSRIRMRRQFVGMSQEKLGELLGITFQ